jgi:ubiquinone/menaquinone biosynthesis C-methylase UbiE
MSILSARPASWRDTGRLLGLFLGPSRGRAATLYDLLSTSNTLAERSLYLNLGYWRHAATYDDACEDLARLLAEAAGLGPADTVLDVGFGFGDQDLLWMETSSPRRIVGLNIAERQVHVAQQQIAARGWARRVHLQVGSATQLPFRAHVFDKVTVLEAAFHFQTREAFFHEAWRVLRPGGRLALADIVTRPEVAVRFWHRLGHWAGRALWQSPRANMYAADTYREKLQEAGFERVELTSIREHVYGAFVRFARGRLDHADVAHRLHPLIRLLWMASVRDEAAYDGLEYLIATADKPHLTSPGPRSRIAGA